MPVYDYVCGSCRHRFEVFHGLNESGPRQCPLCEGPVSRAFAPPTIVFKGSGWAKVDRRATSAPSKSRGTESSSAATKTSTSPSDASGATQAPGSSAAPKAD
jgi:putative FmdB family regulatory protein